MNKKFIFQTFVRKIQKPLKQSTVLQKKFNDQKKKLLELVKFKEKIYLDKDLEQQIKEEYFKYDKENPFIDDDDLEIISHSKAQQELYIKFKKLFNFQNQEKYIQKAFDSYTKKGWYLQVKEDQNHQYIQCSKKISQTIASLYIKVKLLPEENFAEDAEEIYEGDLFAGRSPDRIRQMSETEEGSVTGTIKLRDSMIYIKIDGIHNSILFQCHANFGFLKFKKLAIIDKNLQYNNFEQAIEQNNISYQLFEERYVVIEIQQLNQHL